jgi:L-alanine-DL-glutamate epimerase-like enolase superfamily enzyme
MGAPLTGNERKFMSRITEVRIVPFVFGVADLGLGQHAAMGVSNLQYQKGGVLKVMRYGVRILTDDGLEGSYVTHWVGTQGALGQTLMLAPHLLGRDPEHRELIYDDCKRELRAYDGMGYGPLDIALWDLAGKKYGIPVAKMLGGYKSRLPVYASTHHGQEEPGGLDSPLAFGEYAVACAERGFAGFKIHGWHDGDVKRESETLRVVRRMLGDRIDVMYDPGCQLRTHLDALKLGHVCDEIGALWYEDPYRDSSKSLIGSKILREKIKTPLMITEHVRGPEMKAAYAIAGACDMYHIDPEYDWGITGAMKCVHIAEGLGIDVQIHACGPAHRACVSAIRNTHFYELALIGPGMANLIPPIYTCGYDDQVEAMDASGTLPVPDGPGLGVTYDWAFIDRHAIEQKVFAL